MHKDQVHRRCAGGCGDKCIKVKCMGGVWEVRGRCVRGAQEVVGISAERSSAWEVHRSWWGYVQKDQVHGRCTGGGRDKCRKVKCTILYVFITFSFRYTGDPGKLASLQVADLGWVEC